MKDLATAIPWEAWAVAAIVLAALAIVFEGRRRDLGIAAAIVAVAAWVVKVLGEEDKLEDRPIKPQQPPPDTTVDELDDAIDEEVIDEQPDPLDPDDYPDDDPAVVDKLSQWADDV